MKRTIWQDAPKRAWQSTHPGNPAVVKSRLRLDGSCLDLLDIGYFPLLKTMYNGFITSYTQQSVTFHKFRAQYNIQRKDGEMLWQQDAIKALRKHMGLTQSEFSQEISVRRQTVSEWENGAYDPDRSTTKFLELIAKQSDFQAPVSEELSEYLD